MKNLKLALLSLILAFNSCSKDQENTNPLQNQTITQSTITSFSKNYGYTDETISIFGENFTTNPSDVSVKFDNITATVVSASNTEIKCILPSIVSKIPILNLSISNRTISNTVANDYNGNIGVLPKKVLNSWITTDNLLSSTTNIYKIKMIDSKKIYCNIENQNGFVYRTLDEGITWKRWSVCGFSADGFFVSTNDSGLANSGVGLSKVAVGGNNTAVNIISNINEVKSISSSNDLVNITIVTQRGVVYISSNSGTTFTQSFSSTLNNLTSNNNYVGELNFSAEIDENHIWVGGSMINQSFDLRKPVVIYKNEQVGTWKEFIFPQVVNETGRVTAINFVNNTVGYSLIRSGNNIVDTVKLFKTTNGGDAWSQVYSNEKFSQITFKDANVGWAILDNKIYKTINGGTSWVIDYTNDSPILNLSYSDNMVFALSNNKMIKYYFQ